MGRHDWKHVVLAVLLFGGAGICEIGGGWLVWKWRKEGWPWYSMVLGSMALVLYGIVPTLQNQPFGRTYAAYGGFFIGLSLLWGFVFDKLRPDRWDVIGSLIAVLGAAIVMFGPRNSVKSTGQLLAPSDNALII